MGLRSFLVDILVPNVISDKGVQTTSTPTSDVSYSGITTELTAGENLAFGDVCYVKSDGKLWKADADASTTMPVVAMAVATILADASGLFLVSGFVRKDAWNWTAGGVLYASTSAGEMTHTPVSGTADISQAVGVATNADRVYFNPSISTVEVA